MLSSRLKFRPDELAEKAWARVAPFLSLQANEEEYIASIHDGSLRLDLLFPEDATEAVRLARHPAIEWKIKNVRSYQSRKNHRSK